MATILFSAAAANPALVSAFNPATDILLFDTLDPTQVKVTATETDVTFSNGAESVTLTVALAALTSGTTGMIRFSAGGGLFVGDNTTATVADPLANNMVALATAEKDQLRGLGGNDTLDGGLKSDLIYGNQGNDSIFGAATDNSGDTVFGGLGDDTINYLSSNGDSILYGNLDNDVIIGSATGDTTAYGGQGDDTMIGGAGDDLFYGNAGNDSIVAGGGEDTVFAGQGDDTVIGNGAGKNLIYGNLGADSIVAGTNGDTVFGGQGNDSIYAVNGGDDVLLGNLDDDLLFVGDADGEDTLTGGAGNDTFEINITTSGDHRITDFTSAEDVIRLHGVTANDLAFHAQGGNIANSQARGNLLVGADIVLNGVNGSVTLAGAAGRTLTGTNLVLDAGDVFAYNVGGTAAVLTGGVSGDVLIAGDAGDTLAGGGAGADTYIGGNGNDLFDVGANIQNINAYYGGDGDDSITATVDSTVMATVLQSGVENLDLAWSGSAGIAQIDWFTSDTSVLTVDAASFTAGQALRFQAGSAGNSVDITTGIGNDEFFLTAQADTVHAGDGNDTVDGYLGNDWIDGGAGNDEITGGVGADTLTGGAGNDVFVFGVGSSGSTVATVDVITDFTAGTDDIDFTGAGAITNVYDQRLLSIANGTDLGVAAGQAQAAAAAGASTAVLFVLDGHTYVYVNDTTAGFSAANDLIVDITGFTGTITTADFV